MKRDNEQIFSLVKPPSSIPDRMKMRFSVYFLLLMHMGIQGESSSVGSFVELIPSIIDNARFAQENFVDSDLIVNPMVPSIHFDQAFSVNGSNCSREMQLLRHDLIARRLWALKSKFF